jgi:hypothetical protein
MLIKAGVDISRLRPEIRKKLTQIQNIMWAVDSVEMIITSTYEGNHSAGSLHYANLAVDLRKDKNTIYSFKEIKRFLGNDYDVVIEKNHIHIEYDPK